MKKIVFRVDSGDHIGMGHVMRCLTLAFEFRKNYFEVFFITKDHNGFLKEIISNQFKVFILSDGLRRPLLAHEKTDYEFWLGESWEQDLKKTNAVISELGGVDLVVIDHYGINEEYEKLLLTKKILVVDDLMGREHYCDFLLDQNTSAELSVYEELTKKKKALLFLGPKYSLLREEFSSLRSLNVAKRNENFTIENILVFFGSADVGSDCLKLASALTQEELKNYRFTFILNEAHSTYKDLSAWAKPHSREVTLLSSVSNMAEVITQHDFFIGAGGSTSWERICLGIPSSIISVAENQIKISESLQKLKLINYLGEGSQIDQSKWKQFFKELKNNFKMYHEMSIRCLGFLDGKGAPRVASKISEEIV